MGRRGNAEVKFLFLAVVSLFGSNVFAFPEMVRHGYMNCVACHASVSGGNLMTEYGRSISKDLLSQTSFLGIEPDEDSEKFLYGVIKPPQYLNLGGDERLLQTFYDSPDVSSARFLIMQLQFDASEQIGDHVRLFASVARVEPSTPDPTAKDYVSSPQHGVEVLISNPDSNNRLGIRVGRFMPAYGIDFAEHTLVTRRLLNFDPGHERYAYEASFMNDKFSLIATGIFQQANNNGVIWEKGGLVQASVAIGKGSKIGASAYQSSRNDSGVPYTRLAYGGFAHIGISKQWYLLAESDWMKGVEQTWGFMDTVKIGDEVFQGWHLIAMQEYAKTNVATGTPKFEAYSIGTEWFPKPHWDFYAVYRKQKDTNVSTAFADAVWLIGHFYL